MPHYKINRLFIDMKIFLAIGKIGLSHQHAVYGGYFICRKIKDIVMIGNELIGNSP